MEAGVEYRYLGNRHNLLALDDTLKVCRVVKRTEVAALLNSSLNLLGNENRARELVTAVKNSVSYSANLVNRLDYSELFVYESVKHKLKCLCVSGHGNGELIILSAGNLELEARLAAYLLANTLCDNCFVVHINKLELKRRAACVDNQYFHFSISFQIYYCQNLSVKNPKISKRHK